MHSAIAKQAKHFNVSLRVLCYCQCVSWLVIIVGAARNVLGLQI
jgi:hypothetical protein